ncbi:MAG: tetratricopeptide repeat protein [Fimbriimonadaceae bacterium]|nr:tetratricopeptide repeat protein [Fimbriimonadaceae bacterium]
MADSALPTPEEVTQRAIDTFKSGDMEAAVPQLRQAIEYDKENFRLTMYLGLAQAKRERWQDAERIFERAAELDGSSADAAYYLGFAIAKQDRLREAHGQFNVALLNDPNHAKAKTAFEQTAKAAEQITKDGSSAVAPGGGLGGIDLTGLDFDFGAKPAKKTATSDVMAAAAELRKGGDAKAGKKAGCGGGIVALLGLLSALLVFWAQH